MFLNTKEIFQIFTIIFLLSLSNIFAQGSAGSKYRYETRNIIDYPNCGVIPKSNYLVSSNIGNGGVVQTEFCYGLWKNFNIGISYSVDGLIGTGEVKLTPYPNLNLKYRIIEEKITSPAIAIGFNTQGRGEYYESENRHITLSNGVYLAFSKAFKWTVGEIAISSGINYPIEKRNNKNPNFYFGIEQTLSNSLSSNMEFSLNSDEDNFFYKEKGLLNFSLRWSMTSNTTIEFQIRDILTHQIKNVNNLRGFGFEYISSF